MKQQTRYAVLKGIANTFGSFGYLFCCMQWFWAALLYLSVIQSISSLVSPITDHQIENTPVRTMTDPNPIAMVLLGVVVVIMVALTIYALIRIPRDIVKTSNKIVHKTANAVTPLVIKTRHKKDTKKIRNLITVKVMLILKALIVTIPVLLTIASKLLEQQSIDYSIALFVGWMLASCSAAAFIIQYILAWLVRIKLSDIR